MIYNHKVVLTFSFSYSSFQNGLIESEHNSQEDDDEASTHRIHITVNCTDFGSHLVSYLSELDLSE